MFSRVSSTIFSRHMVLGNLETPSKSAAAVQIVRWRKRRWSPKNPSKIYYVREPTPEAEDPKEKEELHWRYKNHRTHMRAMTAYFKAEVAAKNATLTSKIETDKHAKEWRELLDINEKWNQETAEKREARQMEQEMEEEKLRLKTITELEEDELVKLMEAQSIVQTEMENAKYFINTENLEEQIEKTLNMRTTFNFAIDLEGNRYIEQPDGSVAAETKDAESVRQILESQQDKNTTERVAE